MTTLLELETKHIRHIVAQLPAFDYVLIAARGSSDHAATYATYAWTTLAGYPVALAAPSLLTIYQTQMRLADALVVGISQAGQSPDIIVVLEEAKRQGRPTLAITNDGTSPLAAMADYVVVLPRDPSMSVEEYLQIDRSSIETRYEYIDGYVTMLAGGTLDHATIGANIISILRRSLRGTPCRVFTSDARVRLSRTRFAYPDASVSCDEQDRGQSDNVKSPRLVVEVLSPSTEGYDRGRKFGFYRECPTIQEYLLIDAQRPMLEVYRREKHDLWILRAYRLDEEVELTNLGLRFPVSEIYEDVIFPPGDVLDYRTIIRCMASDYQIH